MNLPPDLFLRPLCSWLQQLAPRAVDTGVGGRRGRAARRDREEARCGGQARAHSAGGARPVQAVADPLTLTPNPNPNPNQ
eukprot:scaffold8916_cov35-Phaeocystis_antarctica.AAC.1